jgi:3-deoxy-manno-octulosonate cytidylyltransferase (CMP-KDO synthetase)
MNVLGIIPSRYASTRFPGKPLIDLDGKPMVRWVYEGAKACDLFAEVIVATDDERILNTVEAFGGKAMMTSENHPNGTSRCAEVAKAFPDMDIVINIQGDEPLVNPKQLEQLIQLFRNEEVKIATLAKKGLSPEEVDNPNRVKVVLDNNSDALYFSRSKIPFPFDQNSTWDYLKHIGLYGFQRSVLLDLSRLNPSTLMELESLEQLNWLYHGYKIRVGITEIETPNIDTPEDIEKVLEWMKR